MRLTVTKADIRKARKDSRRYDGLFLRWYCPIAQALRRQRPDLVSIEVADAYIAVRTVPGGRQRYVDLPLSAQRYIDKFADGEEVEPATFIIKGL